MKNFKFKISGVKIDFSSIFQNIVSVVWQLVLSTIVFYLIAHFGKKIINKYLAKRTDTLSKRAQTISALVNSIFQYTMIFFYLYAVLTIIGIPVGTLIAGAGVVSLAIGLGAQGFMSDLVNGFFILSEGQFDVGDNIQIGTDSGTVTQLGLRTTRIMTSDGTMIFIPNRQITIVKNLTHGGIGLNLDLNLKADSDLEKVKQVLEQADSQLTDMKDLLVSGPTQLGVIEQNGQNIIFRVHFQVKPGSEGKIRKVYWDAYLTNLRENDIQFAEVSFPNTTANK